MIKGGIFFMERIKFNNVSKSYGDKKLFEIPQLVIQEKEKIGIVGVNGSGKSTLFDLIAGKIRVDTGTISVKGKIAYLEQFTQKENHLSGGERQIKKIEEILRKQADILLADEPSNNLDVEAKEELKRKLMQYPKTLLLISHDRKLLDDVCSVILEIDQGKIKRYKGNYTQYKKQKEVEEKRNKEEYEQYVEEKNRLEKAIRQAKNTAKVMRKAPKRMGNSEARLHKREAENKKEKIEKHSKALETRLEKLQEKERTNTPYTISMKMPEELKQKAKYVFSTDSFSLKVGYKQLLEKTKLNLLAKGKTALIGKNGVGKTTLLKNILTNNQEIKLNPNIKIGYYGQDLEQLEEEKTILENVLKDSSQNEIVIRNILAKLNFKGKEISKKVGVLSGGEKVKVALAKILTSKSNFLILDEPTNFLDIVAIEAIEELMKAFQGGILFVTHDQELIDHVADHLWIIENNKVVEYEGNYSQYLNEKMRKKQTCGNEELLRQMKLAQLTSELAICKDEEEKKRLEKEYFDLI